MQKNILLFQYQLKKNLIMVKTSFRVTLKPLSELADNLSEIYKKIM